MPEDDDSDLTEGQKQLYRKTKVPHKFCPYCGTRNEADASRCSNCGKDISWMKVPEPIPAQEPPRQKPRSMPEQQKVFTPRAIIVFILILIIIAAVILIIVFTTKSKGATLNAVSVQAVQTSTCAGPGCPPGCARGAAACPRKGACPCGGLNNAPRPAD